MKKHRGDCPREKNFNAGSLYAGSLSNEIIYGSCTGQRAVVDSHACTLTLSLNILMFIADTVMLFHSPCGCLDDSNSVGMIINKMRALESQNPFQWELRNIHLCSTNMDEKSVIYGGEEKLKDAIKLAKQRYNPRLIAVMVSCSSSIIGDDVVNICKESEQEFGDGTFCIPIHSQGYQTHSWVNYTDCIWGALAERVLLPPEEKTENMVNFFRQSNMPNSDIREAERLLSKLGLSMNVLPDLQSIDALQRAPESVLNTGMCRGYYLPMAIAMKEKFNIPYTETPYIAGFDFTDQWLLEVGRLTDRLDKAREFIASERSRIQPELEELRNILSGKKIIIANSHAKTLGLAAVCSDLKMEVKCMFSHFTDDSLLEGKKKLMERIGDVDYIVGSPLYEELARIIKENPDMVICHGELSPLLAHFGIASKCMYLYNYQNTHLGYQGIIEVGKLILRAINNPMRNKILRYAKNETGLNWKDSPFLRHADCFSYVPNTRFNKC